MMLGQLIPLKGNNNFIKGIKVGVCEQEYGVEIDTMLNVIGTVKYDSKNNLFLMESPLYFCLNKK